MGKNLVIHFSKGGFQGILRFAALLAEGMQDFDVPCDVYVRGDEKFPTESNYILGVKCLNVWQESKNPDKREKTFHAI